MKKILSFIFAILMLLGVCLAASCGETPVEPTRKERLWDLAKDIFSDIDKIDIIAVRSNVLDTNHHISIEKNVISLFAEKCRSFLSNDYDFFTIYDYVPNEYWIYEGYDTARMTKNNYVDQTGDKKGIQDLLNAFYGETLSFLDSGGFVQVGFEKDGREITIRIHDNGKVAIMEVFDFAGIVSYELFLSKNSIGDSSEFRKMISENTFDYIMPK